LEATGGKRHFRQGLAFVIANDQLVALERPFAAGKEIRRTATRRCD